MNTRRGERIADELCSAFRQRGYARRLRCSDTALTLLTSLGIRSLLDRADSVGTAVLSGRRSRTTSSVVASVLYLALVFASVTMAKVGHARLVLSGRARRLSQDATTVFVCQKAANLRGYTDLQSQVERSEVLCMLGPGEALRSHGDDGAVYQFYHRTPLPRLLRLLSFTVGEIFWLNSRLDPGLEVRGRDVAWFFYQLSRHVLCEGTSMDLLSGLRQDAVLVFSTEEYFTALITTAQRRGLVTAHHLHGVVLVDDMLLTRGLCEHALCSSEREVVLLDGAHRGGVHPIGLPNQVVTELQTLEQRGLAGQEADVEGPAYDLCVVAGFELDWILASSMNMLRGVMDQLGAQRVLLRHHPRVPEAKKTRIERAFPGATVSAGSSLIEDLSMASRVVCCSNDALPIAWSMGKEVLFLPVADYAPDCAPDGGTWTRDLSGAVPRLTTVETLGAGWLRDGGPGVPSESTLDDFVRAVGEFRVEQRTAAVLDALDRIAGAVPIQPAVAARYVPREGTETDGAH